MMVENAWHFSPVIELNNLLSSRAERQLEFESSKLFLNSPSILISPSDDHQNPPGLGNFDKIWNYLSLPPSVPSVQIESSLEISVASAPTEDLYDKSTTDKGVRWWDATKSANLANKDIASKAFTVNLIKGLTKKERRRIKQEEIERGCSSQTVLSSSTERAFGDNRRQPNLRSTSEAVIQKILSDSLTRLGTPSKISGPIRKPHNASDHGTSPLVPLRPLRGSFAALNTDQTAYNTAAEKKEHLMKTLRLKFAEENESLDNIPVLPRMEEDEDNNLKCIHVFVDASNVRITVEWLTYHVLSVCR
jgi:hypothetical protein